MKTKIRVLKYDEAKKAMELKKDKRVLQSYVIDTMMSELKVNRTNIVFDKQFDCTIHLTYPFKKCIEVRCSVGSLYNLVRKIKMAYRIMYRNRKNPIFKLPMSMLHLSQIDVLEDNIIDIWVEADVTETFDGYRKFVADRNNQQQSVE